MNSEQIMSLVRDVLRVGGTIAGMLGIAAGVVDTWTSLILTIAGPAATLIGILWGVLSNGNAALVASVSSIPAVKAMTITDPTLANAARAAPQPAVVNNV